MSTGDHSDDDPNPQSVPASTFSRPTTRAKFTLFDGLDPVGRVPLEVWEDTFNSTFKVANYEPPKGVQCQ